MKIGQRFYPFKIPPRSITFVKRHLFLTSILLTAFFIRIYLFQYRSMPEGDGCHYVSFAKDFMRGEFSTVGTYWSIGWPGLIALFSLIFKNVEFVGRLLSTFAGVALIAVSHFFVKKLFSKRIAHYVALLLATNFSLISYSTLLFTESLYCLLVVLIALFGWISLERKRISYYFLLGLILGFSYTVRNESLAFIVLFLPMIIIRNYKKAFINILFLFLGIIIFILPMVLFYHNQFGCWTLGAKGTVNFLYGEECNVSYSYRKLSELTEDFGEPIYLRQLRYKFGHTNFFVFLSENKIFSRVLLNIKRLFLYLPNQFFSIPFIGKPISLFFFIFGSFACLIKNKLRLKRYFYLLLFPSLSFILVSLCFMEERKVVPFIPFYLFVICVGIHYLERLLHSKIIKGIYISVLISIFIISAVTAFDKAKVDGIGLEHKLMKEAGLWMRKNLSQSKKVIAQEPYLPYFFYENTPNNFSGLMYFNDCETLIRYMRAREAEYLAIFSCTSHMNPVVDYLFKNRQVKGLELLKLIKKDDQEILIYQLK